MPPNDPNKSCEGALEQRVNAPLLPALGGGIKVMVTVAVAFKHGGVPTTV